MSENYDSDTLEDEKIVPNKRAKLEDSICEMKNPKDESEKNDKEITLTQEEKRQHHNALERRRRDLIKDNFKMLQMAIPNINNQRTSRAEVLQSAYDYMKSLSQKILNHTTDIETLAKGNAEIYRKVKILESKNFQLNTDMLSKAERGVIMSDIDTELAALEKSFDNYSYGEKMSPDITDS
ncbi:dMax [Intoshia linei]|uniref:DMax n=1 Tax=Intoshia linei TaxID=1819745 RepID=A0A177B7T1_9BILA|nr:dMax [Intoshia linei]